MTGTTMDESRDWGAHQERRRVWKRRRYAAVLAVISVAFPLSIKHFASSLSAAAAIALIVAYFIAVMIAAAFHWRRRDEIERRLAMQAMAAIGVTSIVAFPFFTVIAAWWPIAAPARTAWMLSMIAGIVAYVVQRLRA